MRSLLALTILGTLGLASTARAESGQCRQEDDQPLQTRVEIINGKRVTVIITDIVICGHRPRPAVAYVTPAKNIEYTWESLTANLVPLILDTVKTGSPR